MLGDLDSSQEHAILALMTKYTSIVDLNTLLNVVVQELPGVLGARGCWIYLQSDYVPKYSGMLQRNSKEYNEIDIDSSLDDFIVLAATNLDSKKELIGKAFFRAGEGITGWVYKNSKPLRISNVMDDLELKQISHDLIWVNEYHDGDELYEPNEKRPILAVPLVLDNSPIGTLKFHATLSKEPFSEVSEKISVIVAQIISGVIRQSWLVAKQNETITRLIETSNKQATEEVIADVTSSMKEMLNCTRSEVFLRSEDGAKLLLIAKNGFPVSLSSTQRIERGDSLVGWVYKTGLPLVVPDIRKFIKGVYLDKTLLENISSGEEINEADKFIKDNPDTVSNFTTNKLQSISFMAVPIKSKYQEVQGVLCAYRNISTKIHSAFDRTQLVLATSFANTIGLLLENTRQRLLAELLIELGGLNQTDQLFSTITSRIPKLVASSGCSIYTSRSSLGVSQLTLIHTSRKDIIREGGTLPKIQYELGEGKTGTCAIFQSPLVANHYGSGIVSAHRVESEIERIRVAHPNDITSYLVDSSHTQVGLFQLQSDEKLPLNKRYVIREFAKTIVFQEKGIVSTKLSPYLAKDSDNTWSFIAVPISSDKNLLGVITLARPIPETPFLPSDISLLKSIAGRLASVMINLRLIEHRHQLVMSLAHEINTPLTGILADSQNLHLESPENSDLRKIAQHNLEQVQRLQMQASTIMAVLSEKKTTKQFAPHSIFRPLKEACKFFTSEASQKGCDIVGPRARDGEFPDMSMSLVDLAIAFKNIIHNAVKYSFRPPASRESLRTIKVWGQWNESRSAYYDVYIQNYGVGILPYEIERKLVFQPFYRGERASQRMRTGSGFGLAHARLVIEEMHHGFISVSSIFQEGDGFVTTFIVSLPINQAK